MANIEQNICDAIEVIANNLISKAGFDRTIQATILSCVNEATGKYKLRYQDSNIYAFTGDENKKYSRGTQVYVLVPGSDMSKNKTILGEVGDIIAYDPDSDNSTGNIVYERSSENLIQVYKPVAFEDEVYEVGIYSKYIDNRDTLVDGLKRYGKTYCPYPEVTELIDSPINVKFVDNEVVNGYIKDSKYFYLGASFKTDFEDDVITQGDYGLKLHIRCKNPNATNSSNQTVINILTLDTNNGITGNPYYFENYSYKYWVFPIPENFIEFESLEFFCRNFDKGEGSEGVSDGIPINPDIMITNVGLYTANSINELLGGNGITLTYPKGRSIYKDSFSNNQINSLSVSASIIENSKLMSENLHSFYWFKRDYSVVAGEVSSDDNKNYYNSYGGAGWQCLNDYEQNVGWVPASNTFNFDRITYLLDVENIFKVVAIRTVGETLVKYEREFTLFNYNYNFLIDIYSSQYQNFALNRSIKDLDLICRIKNNDDEQTEIPVNRPATGNKTCYKDFSFYWCAIIDGDEYLGDRITERLTGAEFYDINTVINPFPLGGKGRKIRNINLGLVKNENEGITFGCTIKQQLTNQKTNEKYMVNLKTIYIRIGIDQFNQSPYTILITNKNQVFQYSEYNKSPFADGEGAPNQLGLKLIDNQIGQELDIEQEIREGRLEIAWQGPANLAKSFIKVDANYQGDNSINVNEKIFYLNYNFKINDTFEYEYAADSDNNQISISAKYKGYTSILTDTTQFTFIKQGMYGTNGTEYVAKIVTKWGTTPKWITFTSNSYYSIVNDEKVFTSPTIGYFNFLKEVPNSDTDWFAVLSQEFVDIPFTINLYKNGEIQTNIDIKKHWYMKTLGYGYPEKKVKSNFEINGEQIKFIPELYTDNNTDQMREYMPSNILCCEVTYPLGSTKDGTDRDQSIIAYLPIVRISNRTLQNESLISMPKIEMDVTKGFNEVIYNRDGLNLEKCNVKDNEFVIKLNRSLNTKKKGKFISVGVNGRDPVQGNGSYKWNRSNNLKIEDKGQTTYDDYVERTVVVNPVYSYNGDCANDAIFFRYTDNDLYIDSYIHIPICLHLNQYSLAAFNGWDGISVDINNEEGYIIAPQVMAGKKETDNTFTGVVMGDAKDSTQKDAHTGLYSYNHGEKTFGVYAENGFAFFGKQNDGRIIIDPTNNIGSFIYSKGFFANAAFDRELGQVNEIAFQYPNPRAVKAGKIRPTSANQYYGNRGMLINLTDGGIYYGNGKFALDEEGNLTSIGGHFWNGETGDNEAYLDLNPNQPAKIHIDEPRNGLYGNVLKYKKKLKITKNDGTILSLGGHFSNMNGSTFIDFQPANDTTAYITTDTGIIPSDQLGLNLNSVPFAERVLYPEKITGFLLYCLNPEAAAGSYQFRDIENLKFGITKAGNVFAKKGKIGSFYLDETYFRTNYGGHQNNGDITLSTSNFDMNFRGVNFIFDRTDNDFIISFNHSETLLENTRFAIGLGFAVTSEGSLFCQDIHNDDLISDTIKTRYLSASSIYADHLYVRTEIDATYANIKCADIDCEDIKCKDIECNGDLSTDIINSNYTGYIAFNNNIRVRTAQIDTIETYYMGDIGSRSYLELPNDVRTLYSSTHYSLPWMTAVPGTSSSSPPLSLPYNCIYLIYDSTSS